MFFASNNQDVLIHAGLINWSATLRHTQNHCIGYVHPARRSHSFLLHAEQERRIRGNNNPGLRVAKTIKSISRACQAGSLYRDLCCLHAHGGGGFTRPVSIIPLLYPGSFLDPLVTGIHELGQSSFVTTCSGTYMPIPLIDRFI